MGSEASGLGHDVAVGLAGGPENFERLRRAKGAGLMAPLWGGLAHRAQNDKNLPLPELALAAAVERRADWAGRAVERAVEMVRMPAAGASGWIHRDAGCMSLSGGHHTLEIALVIDWLWPVIGRDRREALVQGLIAQGVENLTRTPEGTRDPGDGRGRLLTMRRLDKADPNCLHPVFEQVNNWDIWFATGLYLAACVAERAYLKPEASWPKLEWGTCFDTGFSLDAARIERWKGVAQERIETAIASQLGPDGDFGEGVNYAGYAGEALVYAMAALQRTGRMARWPQGVLALPRWARNQYAGEIGSSAAANFNDSTLEGRVALPLFAHVASQGGDPQTQAITLDAVARSKEEASAMLLLGLRPELPAAAVELPRAAHYRHTGTVNWRTGREEHEHLNGQMGPGELGVLFSLKSGAHGGAHQHRDRNSLFLWAHGEPLVVDSGDSRYSSGSYGANFFETAAHNCVLIDGRGQVGDNTRPLAGKILEHRDEGEVSTLLAEAGMCYEGVKQCRRRVVFLRPSLFVVADRVRGGCAELTWLLHGYNADGAASWSVDGRHLRLTRPGARLDVFFVETPAQAAISAGTLEGKPGGTLRAAVSIKGAAATAVLVPSRTDEQAPEAEWEKDGGLTVRFSGTATGVRAEAGRVRCNGVVYEG
ncbi:MAG: heparinase II/III family protein [Planctomycetota bacterium]|nr:heparinase II/III family protein [Planctomycetota bacterium]